MNKMLIKAMVIMIIALTGCAMQQAPQQKPQSGQQMEQVQAQPELAEQVKDIAKGVQGVDESTAVVINDEISAGLKVSGFDRLRLKSIRKDVTDQIKKSVPGYQVHVTTDKKLFAELQKAETEIKQQPQGQKLLSIKQRVDKIIKDMRG